MQINIPAFHIATNAKISKSQAIGGLFSHEFLILKKPDLCLSSIYLTTPTDGQKSRFEE